jgi:uncharacterized metal-binding protein YceD (DUF177 family)
MKVHLRQIPEGTTLHIEGEEDATPLGLEEADASPAGPLRYSLDVGLSGGGLFATGKIAVRARMQCVGCLGEFESDIVVDPISLQTELTGSELIDLTPSAREDIHLHLPAHPRCDAGGGPECPAVRGAAIRAGSPASAPGATAWDVLDQLKTKKN